MQHHDFDAIVVGARVAGASTALLLARHGHRVLLIDRARFPSEIAAGHFVHRHGPQRLARWGLLDKVRATGAPDVTEQTSYFGDFLLTARDLAVDGVPWAIGPRRARLDQLLVDAATSAGAEFMDGTPVDGLLTDDDARVTGVRLQNGTRIRARLTVGAEGRHSKVASSVGAPAYETVPTLACWYFTYWADVPQPRMEMHVLPERRAIFTFPTNDGLLATFVGFPIEEFAQVRAEVEGSMLAAFDLAPELGPRIRAARRVERVYGTADVPNFLRKPFGPGWALVGDAGCHKDPFLALGCCDALRDAEFLAEAASVGLSDQEPFETALDGYEQRRNAACLPDYVENVRMARLQPVPPEVLGLRAAVRERPEDARAMAMATQGLLAREAFFNPRNLSRLLGPPAATDPSQTGNNVPTGVGAA